MNDLKKLKEYKEITLNLIKLSLPILGGNVSQILISFADNIIADGNIAIKEISSVLNVRCNNCMPHFTEILYKKALFRVKRTPN